MIFIYLIQSTKIAVHSFLFALLASFLPYSLAAQSIFEENSNNPDASYFSADAKVFELLGQLNFNSTNDEANDFLNIIKKIDNFQVLTSKKPALKVKMLHWLDQQLKKETVVPAFSFEEPTYETSFYVKSDQSSKKISRLIMVVEENEQQSSGEMMIMQLDGHISLEQLAKFARQIDVPGGRQLSKLSHQTLK